MSDLRHQTGENGRAHITGWERGEDKKKLCAVLEKIAPQVRIALQVT
jgi:hypothetical protein